MSQGRARAGLFTVLVTVAVVVGSLITTLVLAGAGTRGSLVAGSALAALPVGPVLAAFLWPDRHEPEPRSLLLLGSAWGAVVATSIALVAQLVDSVAFGRPDVVSATLVAPVVEEAGLFPGPVGQPVRSPW